MTTEQLAGTTVRMPSLGESVTKPRSPAGSKPQVTTSTRRNHCSRWPPTKSTPRSRPLPPAFSTDIIADGETTVVEVGAALAIISAQGRIPRTRRHPLPRQLPRLHRQTATSAPARAPVSNPTDPGRLAALSAAGDRVEKLPRIRRTIAQRMLESLQTQPN